MFIFSCSGMKVFILVTPFPLISKGEDILVRPLPLMSKGESVLVLLLPSSPKGDIVGIMIQVLSLMATHSDDSSQYNMSTTKNYRSDYKE